MADSFETSRDYRATILQSFLKIMELCDIPHRFYESLNEKNWMCDLCTFSQIQSHIGNGYQNSVGCTTGYAAYVVARFSNRIGRDSGSTSGCPVVQLGVRLCNRHPVAQPARLRIRAEHIYEFFTMSPFL